MNIVDAALLGCVQGVTEFLPISSSGHLVAIERILGAKQPNSVLFEVALHLGTLCAVIAVYRRELLRCCSAFVAVPRARPRRGRNSQPSTLNSQHLTIAIVLGTVPTVAIGVAFEPLVKRFFDAPQVAGWGLMLTGVLLFVSRYARRTPTESGLPAQAGTGGGDSHAPLEDHVAPTIWVALLIGTIQGVAIVPGISRSGSTIALGLLLGLEGRLAADFSFLLSVPAVLGAAIWSLRDLGDAAAIGIAPLAIGFLVAFATGVVAILAVLRIVRRGKLWYFSPYCIVIGGLIALTLARG